MLPFMYKMGEVHKHIHTYTQCTHTYLIIFFNKKHQKYKPNSKKTEGRREHSTAIGMETKFL